MTDTLLLLPAKHRYQLIKVLRLRLYSLEDDLNYHKEMIGFYWKLSDKDKSSTGSHFANLNHCKTRARIIRKELKIIRENLKVLK